MKSDFLSCPSQVFVNASSMHISTRSQVLDYEQDLKKLNCNFSPQNSFLKKIQLTLLLNAPCFHSMITQPTEGSFSEELKPCCHHRRSAHKPQQCEEDKCFPNEEVSIMKTSYNLNRESNTKFFKLVLSFVFRWAASGIRSGHGPFPIACCWSSCP